MLKILALFTIFSLSLSLTTVSWVGRWNVTSQTGTQYCGAPPPTVDTIVTLTAINSTALNMTGANSFVPNASWVLNWNEYNSSYSNCVSAGDHCVKSDLESHGNETHAKVTFYCSYLEAVFLYRGFTLVYVGPNESEEVSEEFEVKNFLDIIE